MIVATQNLMRRGKRLRLIVKDGMKISPPGLIQSTLATNIAPGKIGFISRYICSRFGTDFFFPFIAANAVTGLQYYQSYSLSVIPNLMLCNSLLTER